MAHVENTVMDVYYRNDSMKSVRAYIVSSSALLLQSMAAAFFEASHGRGGIWYLQSRVKEKKREDRCAG